MLFVLSLIKFPFTNYLKSLIILFFAVLTWSAIYPQDYFTWFLEVLTVLIGFLVFLTIR